MVFMGVVSDSSGVHAEHAETPGRVILKSEGENGNCHVDDFVQNVGLVVFFAQHMVQIERQQCQVDDQRAGESLELL